MRKYLLHILIISFVFLSTPVIHSAKEEKDRLLVVPLKAKGDVSQDDASILTDILSVEIIRSDLFTVLNRDDMKAILDEKEFEQAMGCEDNICLLENVAKLSVSKVIAGSIGLLGKKYIVSVKLINKDGQTERMLKESCSCPIEDLEKTIETISYKFLKPLGGKVASDGSIRVESSPKGARIYLDGNNIGTTPDSIRRIVAGTHKIEVKMDGYEVWSKSVEVEAGGEAQINAKLTLSHVAVGQALLEQGKVEDAAIEFKKAIKRNPDLAEAHFGLGNAYVEKQELEEALLHYREAIKLDSKFVEAYKRLSETFIEMGSPDSYFEEKYNAIEGDLDIPIARIDLEALYHNWDQTRNAITEYEEALTLDPDNPFIYYNLAVAYQDMNLFEDKAIPLLMKTIELQPNYDNAHYNLAVSYLKSGRLENAMVEYKKTLEINPNYAPVYVDYGMIQLKNKNLEAAMRQYDKALEIDPRSAEAYYQKGIVYAFQENYDEALKMNRKALEINPKHINSQFNIAVVYHKSGELKRAIAEYNLTLEIDKHYQDAYYNRGQIYASMGNRPQAYGDYIAYSKILKAKTGKEGVAMALRGIEDKEQVQKYHIPSFEEWLLEHGD